MAACKKNKIIKQTKTPGKSTVVQKSNPEQYYSECPAWRFSSMDKEKWTLDLERTDISTWTEIFEKLNEFDGKTWQDILISSKKFNHSIDTSLLNKCASDRLEKLHIEAESIISLRFSGTHRLYGYMTGHIFNVLWYDDNHGDNNTCVCRSWLKHT